MGTNKRKSEGRYRRLVLPLVCLIAAIGILCGLFVIGGKVAGSSNHNHKSIGSVAALSVEASDTQSAGPEETELKQTPGEDYSLTVKFRNGQEVIRGIFTDRASSDADSTDESEQRTVTTPNGDFLYKVSDLQNMVNNFPEMQDANMTQPVNARIEKTDSGFAIAPQSDGTVLDKQAVLRAVENAVSGCQKELDLTTTDGIYQSAEISADNEALNQQLAALNQTVSASITYTLPTSTRTLDGSTTVNWLTQNADGSWTKDDAAWNQHIADYVAQLAADTDTVNSDRTFHATGIGDVTIKGTGYYGYEVNQSAEISQLTDELNSGAVTTREPVYSVTAYASPDDNNGFGQNYVEADLSRQHIWVYVNGQVAYETDCVSGTMNESYHTPEGAFMLLNKEKDATLLGDQIAGKENYYTYTQPVSYWMPFTYSGCGMHDATWRGAFGGDIYIANGSHGCLNLPLDAAAQIYNLVSVREPVIIYYSEGYTLAPAPAPVQTEGVYYDKNAAG